MVTSCLSQLETVFSQISDPRKARGVRQRPLLELLQEHSCDYLFQVKANQPDMLDALETCFFQETPAWPYGLGRNDIASRARETGTRKGVRTRSRNRTIP